MSLLQRLAVAIADQLSAAAPSFTVVTRPTGVEPRHALTIAYGRGAK
jgi:hypothetical protein